VIAPELPTEAFHQEPWRPRLLAKMGFQLRI
jgi:hypothetical protein